MADSNQITKKIRILIVLDILNLGGAERQALLLAQSQNKTSPYQPIVVLLQEGGNIEDKILLHGLTTMVFPFRFRISAFGRILEMIRYAIRLRALKPDIILPYTIRPNVIVNFAWQFTGAKACCWNQRDEGFGFPTGKDRIFDWSFNNSKAFVANSTSTMEVLQRRMGRKTHSSIRVIKNGIKFINFDKASFEMPDTHGKLILCMVANLTTKKDQATLIKSLALLKSSGKEPLLILAGAWGDNYQTLVRLVEQLDLSDDVVLAGQVLDIERLLNKTDIAINSSVSEGMPNSVLEYMLAGKPVVASDISAHRELLGNDYPYLFKPQDERDLADKLTTLIEDRNERLRIGRNNKSFVEIQFSVEAMAEAYEQLFEKLVND
jgi:glycosyltransferase involved in cell wall biosynthesis